jgi:hypothetical protein
MRKRQYALLHSLRLLFGELLLVVVVVVAVLLAVLVREQVLMVQRR